MDDRNRNAVEGLLADAERTVALVNIDDLRGNREIVPNVIAHAQRDYVDLVRRSQSLIMTDNQRATFSDLLDRLREALRFFGESL